MVFYVDDEVSASFDFDAAKVAKEVAQAVLDEEGLKHEVEISLIITDDEGIRSMNREFRNIDRSTDVLSFPNVNYKLAGDFSVIDTEQKIDLLNPDTGNIMFGDIVINEARVRMQAEEYGHSTLREFAFLIAHSMLHLCGYDHIEQEEAAVMEKKQREVLEKLGITRE